MKTNKFWTEYLAPQIHWKTAYPVVEREVREYLTQMAVPVISTNALVEAIFPIMSVRGLAGDNARARLFKALRALSDHALSDCVTEGEGEKLYGQEIRRNIWKKPQPKCSHCNGTGFEP